MTGLLQDLRYALRQLRKNPGFACTAILILALGIGGTTAIFSVLNPILFEPLPYPHAERLMTIWYAAEDGSRVPQTFHTYQELAERNRTFESLAVMKLWQPALNGINETERLDGQRVSASYFRTLGVHPALGRDFQPSDDVGFFVDRLHDDITRGVKPALLAASMDRRSSSSATDYGADILAVIKRSSVAK